MAGVYIHIPFCAKACHYCDFHFTTSKKYVDEMVDAVCHETYLYKDFFTRQNIETIYFGGGTPSILSIEQIQKLLHAIYHLVPMHKLQECTFEANPEDITREKLDGLKKLGINRISLGVQTFQDQFLLKLNRNHTAKASRQAIEWILETGFDTSSIDLIYGLPWHTHETLKNDLEVAIGSGVKHLSAYSLTIESKTAFGKWIKQGKMPHPIESEMTEQQLYVWSQLEKNGFEAYEISNYCKENQYAKHNTAYWQGKPYLGLGPSAHSFDGEKRWSNVCNNKLYMQGVLNGKPMISTEMLDDKSKLNEYLLTRLRTKWGAHVFTLAELSGNYWEELQKLIAHQIANGNIVEQNAHLKLTTQGKMIADTVISTLFWI